jgi:AGZA family xanthine/uracil permease-like MFS transporter
MVVDAKQTTSVSWFGVGDLNAFFALFVDNVVNLVMLTAILVFQFGMPSEFVLSRMIPGTALGVMIGDLAYSWMACRGGRRLTAMPLGLDTPSTIGMTIAVIGPVFLETKDPYMAWGVGMATLFIMGVAKLVMSFFGEAIAKAIPMAGLLGPLAGIGLALLGLIPMVHIFSMPVAGVFATGIILYAFVANHRLPFGLPGALVAVVMGLIIYWVMVAVGIGPQHQVQTATVGLYLPKIEFAALAAGMSGALKYLPISIPFGLLTIVGGINVTASAKAAGDDFRTRDILLVESVSTMIAAICGGVAQTTPYIGHPAYKAMGAKAGYTLLTGLVIGIAGFLGILGVLIDYIPQVVVAPILLFVGLMITEQAFKASEQRHLPAVAFAIIPCLAYLVMIYAGQLLGAGAKPGPVLAGQLGVMSLLGNGFIVTSMLWAAAIAYLIDKRPTATFVMFAILAVCSLFGIIHSVSPTGSLYLPFSSADNRPLELAAAYLLTGGSLAFLLRFVK